MVDETRIISIFEEAERRLADNSVYLALRPPAGAYALFHHQGFVVERCGDLRIIFQRMAANRQELGEAVRRELKLNPIGAAARTRTEDEERELQAASDQANSLRRALRFDFECLYTFGAIFLDQWSIVAAYLSGLPNPESMTFFRLAKLLEGGNLPHALEPVAREFVSDVRWLQIQLRTFRNRFVEHADRPWQRGTIAGVHGADFHLHLPSPPGWVNDEEADAEIAELLRLAPKWLQDADDTYWEKARSGALLARLVENIGAVNSQADRDKIAELVGRAGVTTPSFEVLAARIASFAARATPALTAAALERPSEIQLGRPWKTSDEMLADYIAANAAGETAAAKKSEEGGEAKPPASPD